MIIKDYGEVNVTCTVGILSHWVKYWIYLMKTKVKLPKTNIFRNDFADFLNSIRRNKKMNKALDRLATI